MKAFDTTRFAMSKVLPQRITNGSFLMRRVKGLLAEGSLNESEEGE